MAARAPVLVVHGGAGARAADDPEVVAGREGCVAAAAVGYAVLTGGGAALDAVQTAVRVLEDDPRFNAGVGSCLTRAGTVEMDASLMDGRNLAAGAVAGVTGVRNPIDLARAVLDDGEHVLLAGPGAVAFARERGVALTASDFHLTEAARASLVRELERRAAANAAPPAGGGTVGAVAVDAAGHVAAATSTGGMTGKRPGRVGDSPLLGAGTYADDAAGAASATGHGERIIQVSLTKAAIELLRSGADAQQAATRALALLDRVSGRAGIIVVDRDGRVGVACNTASMTWAVRQG